MAYFTLPNAAMRSVLWMCLTIGSFSGFWLDIPIQQSHHIKYKCADCGFRSLHVLLFLVCYALMLTTLSLSGQVCTIQC